MIKRRHGASLTRDDAIEEDVNPNAYIVNIADCMLVLLLGMVIALISYFNVDIAQGSTTGNEVVGIQVDMDQNRDGVVDPGYQRRGAVYYDAASDSYYFVEEAEARG